MNSYDEGPNQFMPSSHDDEPRKIRRHISTFNSFVYNAESNIFDGYKSSDKVILQPNFAYMRKIRLPFNNIGSPEEGICSHYLLKGFIKPLKPRMNVARWTSEGRRLICGTENGDFALWEQESFKFDRIIRVHFVPAPVSGVIPVPIKSIAWSNYANIAVSGDERGRIKCCNSSLRNLPKLDRDSAHEKNVTGLSFSPMGSKYVSCSDDKAVKIWDIESKDPEKVYQEHLAEVKCTEWHSYRSIIATGSKDATVKLWDPRQQASLFTLYAHKKTVTCCSWSCNGNWLATGAKDGTIKIFDIRKLDEFATLRGHECDVASVGWHPQHESLLATGGYNGSLIYWLIGQGQEPHTIVSDAHRSCVNFIAWHPLGHCFATSDHHGIVKFWAREAPGSKLNSHIPENKYEDPLHIGYGPLGCSPSIKSSVTASLDDISSSEVELQFDFGSAGIGSSISKSAADMSFSKVHSEKIAIITNKFKENAALLASAIKSGGTGGGYNATVAAGGLSSNSSNHYQSNYSRSHAYRGGNQDPNISQSSDISGGRGGGRGRGVGRGRGYYSSPGMQMVATDSQGDNDSVTSSNISGGMTSNRGRGGRLVNRPKSNIGNRGFGSSEHNVYGPAGEDQRTVGFKSNRDQR